MEKELIQELMYDLGREKDMNKQIDLIIICADMLCDETQIDAWEFFYQEFNEALIKKPTDIIAAVRSMEKSLRGLTIKVLG